MKPELRAALAEKGRCDLPGVLLAAAECAPLAKTGGLADVVGTLPNGYHDLDMVMQTIDLYEKITLRRSNDLSLTLPGSFVPVNDKNTAVRRRWPFLTTRACWPVWI